jgi:CheY-like chemotaxis protein
MMTILIVDDMTDMADILGHYFSAIGCVTATAYNGSEAINQERRFKRDLIWMDIAMPVRTGLKPRDGSCQFRKWYRFQSWPSEPIANVT